MPRAVDGTRRKDRRKKILDQAKGYWGRRSTNYRVAKDAVAKADAGAGVPIVYRGCTALHVWDAIQVERPKSHNFVIFHVPKILLSALPPDCWMCLLYAC